MKIEIHVHVYGLPSAEEASQIITTLRVLEAKMSKLDDQIQQFVTDTKAAFTAVQSSLENIAADEDRLSAQIEELKSSATELSADNTAKLADILSTAQAMAQRSAAIAANVPEPPEPPPTPVVG